MPTLHFKGKTFVQNHHLAVKYHQLVPKKEFSLTDKVSLHDNLIIQGDNLKALKALLPTYSGKVKCIYIDPPYNTGNGNWIYNDNVNSPMIQEWLGKAVDIVLKEFPDTVISVDTFRSSVAKEAVFHGAALINDISAGTLDEQMFATVATLNVPYILMHMRGNPKTMNKLTHYDNLLSEMVTFLQEKVSNLQEAGVKDIIIDPGFGFAKTIQQNYEILRNLKYFEILELPVLIGVSRKSTIYKSLQIEPEEALNGTTVLNTIALMNGASILRVHDVKEAVETTKLYNLTFL